MRSLIIYDEVDSPQKMDRVKSKKKVALKSKKNMQLIDHIEAIIEQAENSKLSDDFFHNVKPHTDFVENVMDLNTHQSLLFALFVEFSSEEIDVDRFSQFLDCQRIKMIGLMNDK